MQDFHQIHHSAIMYVIHFACVLIRVQLFVALWTIAHQAMLSMGFSRQEHRSGWPFSSPGYLSDTGTEPGSPTLQED